jgi:hypothetical protein
MRLSISFHGYACAITLVANSYVEVYINGSALGHPELLQRRHVQKRLEKSTGRASFVELSFWGLQDDT